MDRTHRRHGSSARSKVFGLLVATFAGGLLGCPEGRSSDSWVDFDLQGHQIVAHLAPDEAGHRQTGKVDGDDVPVRHFGLVLAAVVAATLLVVGIRHSRTALHRNS